MYVCRCVSRLSFSPRNLSSSAERDPVFSHGVLSSALAVRISLILQRESRTRGKTQRRREKERDPASLGSRTAESDSTVRGVTPKSCIGILKMKEDYVRDRNRPPTCAKDRPLRSGKIDSRSIRATKSDPAKVRNTSPHDRRNFRRVTVSVACDRVKHAFLSARGIHPVP